MNDNTKINEVNQHVFVYGTLKKGYPMGDWLNANAEFIGHAITPGLLYDLGAFPGLKFSSSNHDVGKVHGQVFKVSDQKVLDRMDMYEGVRGDEGLYVKKYKPVQLEDGPILTHVLMYEYNSDLSSRTPMEGGLWT